MLKLYTTKWPLNLKKHWDTRNLNNFPFEIYFKYLMANDVTRSTTFLDRKIVWKHSKFCTIEIILYAKLSQCNIKALAIFSCMNLCIRSTDQCICEVNPPMAGVGGVNNKLFGLEWVKSIFIYLRLRSEKSNILEITRNSNNLLPKTSHNMQMIIIEEIVVIQ